MGKKIWLALCGVSILGLGTIGIVNATGGSINDYTANLYNNNVTNTNVGIDTIGTDKDQGGSLIQIIKNAINRVLGMLSLIALVLCLRGGFQIVTAGGDDGKQKKGISVLKHAAIGLAVIGLAWFIVTIVFWLLRGVAGSGRNSTVPNSSDVVNGG